FHGRDECGDAAPATAVDDFPDFRPGAGTELPVDFLCQGIVCRLTQFIVPAQHACQGGPADCIAAAGVIDQITMTSDPQFSSVRFQVVGDAARSTVDECTFS